MRWTRLAAWCGNSWAALPVVGDEVRLEPDGIVLRVDAVDGRAVARVGFTVPGGPR